MRESLLDPDYIEQTHAKLRAHTHTYVRRKIKKRKFRRPGSPDNAWLLKGNGRSVGPPRGGEEAIGMLEAARGDPEFRGWVKIYSRTFTQIDGQVVGVFFRLAIIIANI